MTKLLRKGVAKLTGRGYEPKQLYASLEPGEIRLLQLHRHRSNGYIRCTMRSASISTAEYVALSYCWGSVSDLRTIKINGCLVQVSQNLWDFLEYARTRLRPGFIWIDAICIHQDDLLEKRLQVDQMGRIYQSARRVYSWLGNWDDYPTHVEEFNHLLEWEEVEIETAIKKHLNERVIRHWTYYIGRGDVLASSYESLDLDLIQILKRIFLNAYWTRLWITQEFILARHIRLISNKIEINEEHLYDLLDVMRKDGWLGQMVFIPCVDASIAMHIRELFSCRDRLRAAGPTGEIGLRLDELIRLHADCDCQDPRDRVYALLSLASWPASSEGLTPDYTRSVHAIYSLTFKTLFEDARFRDSSVYINGTLELNLYFCRIASTIMKALRFTPLDLVLEHNTYEYDFACLFDNEVPHNNDDDNDVESSSSSLDLSELLYSFSTLSEIRCPGCGRFLPSPPSRRFRILLCLSSRDAFDSRIHIMFVSSIDMDGFEPYVASPFYETTQRLHPTHRRSISRIEMEEIERRIKNVALEHQR